MTPREESRSTLMGKGRSGVDTRFKEESEFAIRKN